MKKNIKRVDVHRRHRRRRILWLSVAGLIMGYFSFLLLFSDRGLMKFLEVFRTHRNLEQEIHRLEQRNEELRRGVEALKNDPDTIESIARRELGLVKEGELVYQFRRDTEP